MNEPNSDTSVPIDDPAKALLASLPDEWLDWLGGFYNLRESDADLDQVVGVFYD